MKRSVVSLITLLTLIAACQRESVLMTTSPTSTPTWPPMIHITGVVLDADQLPREIPVAGVTILARVLRGIPESETQTRTHTDMEGRFELRILMEYAIYPFWWGEIEVDAPGYEACTVLCYSEDPYVRDCAQVPYGFHILRDCFSLSEDRLGAVCQPGTGCFYKIGLRTSAHTSTPTLYWTKTPTNDK